MVSFPRRTLQVILRRSAIHHSRTIKRDVGNACLDGGINPVKKVSRRNFGRNSGYEWASAVALQPSSDGGALRAVGTGDRGGGIVYRAGRLRSTPAPNTEDEGESSKGTGLFIIKAQAPLDISDDARGGIGRMVPQTLLLHDKTHQYIRSPDIFVEEGEYGHTALLRAVLSERLQLVYLYALFEEDNEKVRIFTETKPLQDCTW
eukprot:jgi/Bigna1/70034/fgenesh1_pg.10_\